MKLTGLTAALVLFLFQIISGQRRDEVINDWIRRIREAPKGHSISPSWSSKSRIPAIGVGELPLQNESDDSTSSYQQVSEEQFNRIQQRPERQAHNTRPALGSGSGQSFFNTRTSEVTRPQREPSPHQTFDQYGPPKTRIESHRPGQVAPFSFDDVGFEFPKFSGEQQQQYEDNRPKRKIPPPQTQRYPDRGPRPDYDAGYEKTYERDSVEEYESPQDSFYRHTPFNNNNEEEEQTEFEVVERPQLKRQQGPPRQGPSVQRGPQTFRPPVQSERPVQQQAYEDEAYFKPPKQKPLQQLRQKPKLHLPRQGGGSIRPYSEQPPVPRARLSQAQVRHSQDYSRNLQIQAPRVEESIPIQRSPVARIDELPQVPRIQPIRVTTPRPIPTPGPADFPPMPPPRPTVPPTHPPQPAPITHPPEHYLPAAHFPNNHLESGTSDEDYDIHEKDQTEEEEEDPGFYEGIPAGFPSLDALGSGFESMRIRNKRSPVDLDTQEHRFRRRQFRNPALAQGQHRRQHTANNDYSFQQNFWDDVDIDTRDFFPQQTPQAQQPTYGQRQRPYKSTSYQNYNQRQNQYSRDPYTQQTIQSYPEDGYTDDALYGVEQNEILGSGNFEVIRGGTFYDEDTYYHANANRKPYKGNYLENFRDFADIKGEYEYNKKKK